MANAKMTKLPEYILDQAGIIAYIDQFGKYIYVNKQWEVKTGISKEKAIGKRVDELLYGSGAMIAVRTGRTINGEMFIHSAAGKEIAEVIKYQPIKDENGEVIGCLAISVFNDFDEAQAFSSRIDQILEEFQYMHSDTRGSGSGAKYTVDSIIGESRAMLELKEQIYIAGASGAACLIEGETGTGKELVAHAIHNASRRSIFPFIRVNCSAIPENLMESEFFGYEEGSFTGGVKGGKSGKFERAHLGSMFLDEINAMNLTMQPKLLRVLQEKEIERVGGAESIPVNVRVISASNMPIEMLIDKGLFRRDLYYRLNIITIRIPPLRDRLEDIYPLVMSFIERNNRENLSSVAGISEEAIEYLMEYDWPGNVRELQNVIERAMASTWSDHLEVAHFKKFGTSKSVFGGTWTGGIALGKDTNAAASSGTQSADEASSLKEQKENSEKAAILNALETSGYNKSKAARLLNISRTLLYKKLEKYNIVC